MVSTAITYLSRLRRDNYVDGVVDTIHVADAVADTDETYGAYAAAEIILLIMLMVVLIMLIIGIVMLIIIVIICVGWGGVIPIPTRIMTI